MKHYAKKIVSAFFMLALALMMTCTVSTNAKAEVAPTGTVSNLQQIGAGETSIEIQWSAVLDADGYSIYISDNGGVTWTRRSSDYTSGTSYTLYRLAAGSRYMVQIRPYNGYGSSDSRLEGTASASLEVFTKPAELRMVADSVKQVGTGTNTATISWTPVAGAAQYIISSGYGADTEIGRTSDISYTIAGLTAGFSGSYYVRPVSINGPYSVSGYPQYTDVKTISIDMVADTLKQSGATADSVTLSWAPVAGATGYIIKGANSTELGRTAEATFTVGGLFAGYSEYFSVTPIAVNGAVTAEGRSDSCRVRTLPTAVAAPTVGFLHSINKMTFNLTGVANADGYELTLYNNKIKKLGTYELSTYYDSVSVKNTRSGFYYKIRPYLVLADGTKLYGPTKAFTNIGQIDSVTIKGHKMTWKKITGASKYIVYRSKKAKKGYKKIGTVKKAAISSSKIVASKKYYYKIVTCVKLGKKTYKRTGIFQKKY